MAPWWRSRRGRELLATGLLLVFCVGSILVLSRVLSAASVRPDLGPVDGDDSAPWGELAKPVLYPPPAPLLDLPHFSYLLNTDPCADEDVAGTSSLQSLRRVLCWIGTPNSVLIVTSHADHVELRSAHRRAYPRAELLRLDLRRVFLLARPATGVHDVVHDVVHDADLGWSSRSLRDEGRRFGDIVQGDFDEAYRNLTYKHTMGLRWAATYCPQARNVIKMDDDIVVDLYQLVNYVNKQPVHALSSALLGYALRGLHPSREPANKWFVTDAEYPGNAFPDFVSGWLYVTRLGVARALADGAARWTTRHRYFWIDDLLLTGMVREAIGKDQNHPITLYDASALYTVHPEVIHCCLAEPDLRCDVLVGPNGGDNDLIVRFQAHAARCHFGQSCRDRPKYRRVEKSCVVRASLGDDRLQTLDVRDGHGQAKQVRLF